MGLYNNISKENIWIWRRPFATEQVRLLQQIVQFFLPIPAISAISISRLRIRIVKSRRDSGKLLSPVPGLSRKPVQERWSLAIGKRWAAENLDGGIESVMAFNATHLVKSA